MNFEVWRCFTAVLTPLSLSASAGVVSRRSHQRSVSRPEPVCVSGGVTPAPAMVRARMRRLASAR